MLQVAKTENKQTVFNVADLQIHYNIYLLIDLFQTNLLLKTFLEIENFLIGTKKFCMIQFLKCQK